MAPPPLDAFATCPIAPIVQREEAAHPRHNNAAQHNAAQARRQEDPTIVFSNMDITVRQLQIFQSVVVAGSMTKASQRIGLSQPSISQQLTKLEERLGTQLINRARTGAVTLSPAGEYWFKACDDILRRLDGVALGHQSLFLKNNVSLRIGAIPTLRGRFAAAAAQISASEPGFTKFELVYAHSSAELVEKLRMHQVNCAIVDRASLDDEAGSFRIRELFEERIAWVVPADVPDSEIADALAGRLGPDSVLMRHVELVPEAALKTMIDGWYRNVLPASMPVFGAPTYMVALDLAAAGIATTLCPVSLLPNIAQEVRGKVRLFVVDDIKRSVVLAMPRHLLTLRAYSNIFDRIAEFVQTEYFGDMAIDQIEPIPRAA